MSQRISNIHQIPPGDEEQQQTWLLFAEYYTGQISLKAFRAKYPHYTVLATDPLVLEVERGVYGVLTKFGSVVYWNCSDRIRDDLRKEVGTLDGAGDRSQGVDDQLEVVVGMENDRVGFSDVHLRELNMENMKLISSALAASVALEHFEMEVAAALRKVEPVVHQLRDEGLLTLSSKEVLKAVGFALGVRSAVLANLTLFDDPPETWEHEKLSMLHSELYDHFDLDERLLAIHKKVEFLTDVNSTLLDLLTNRKSHRLEWIIIILIAIEIVYFFWSELLRAMG